MKDMQGLRTVAEAALRTCGYRLLEFVTGSDRRVRIVIDAEPEVDLKDCVRGHKAVIESLRESGEDPEQYSIEVESPGANRLITGERDFERFRGEGVVVRLQNGTGGRRTLYGVLLGLESGSLRLKERDSRSEMRLPLDDVKEVRLNRPAP